MLLGGKCLTLPVVLVRLYGTELITPLLSISGGVGVAGVVDPVLVPKEARASLHILPLVAEFVALVSLDAVAGGSVDGHVPLNILLVSAVGGGAPSELEGPVAHQAEGQDCGEGLGPAQLGLLGVGGAVEVEVFEGVHIDKNLF